MQSESSGELLLAVGKVCDKNTKNNHHPTHNSKSYSHSQSQPQPQHIDHRQSDLYTVPNVVNIAHITFEHTWSVYMWLGTVWYAMCVLNYLVYLNCIVRTPFAFTFAAYGPN